MLNLLLNHLLRFGGRFSGSFLAEVLAGNGATKEIGFGNLCHSVLNHPMKVEQCCLFRDVQNFSKLLFAPVPLMFLS